MIARNEPVGVEERRKSLFHDLRQPTQSVLAAKKGLHLELTMRGKEPWYYSNDLIFCIKNNLKR